MCLSGHEAEGKAIGTLLSYQKNEVREWLLNQ